MRRAAFAALAAVPVVRAAADEIRDIKPPVSFPRSPVPLILLVILLVLAFLFVLRRILRRRIPGRSSERIRQPHERAYELLESLLREDLPGRGQVKEYYIRLSDIVRRYLEARFAVRSPEMTTEEFLGTLREAQFLTREQKGTVREFLSQCDMVKFAKYGPSPDEIGASYEAARRLVDQTRPPEQTAPQGGRL